MSLNIRYLYAGDSGLSVEFGNQINPELNLKVTKLLVALDQAHITGILDLIPSYRSLYIQYDPLIIPPEMLTKKIDTLLKSTDRVKLPLPRTVAIPVFYGGAYGTDLEFVANYHQLTVEDVIRIHSAGDYTVYMIGFTPGFAYLGGMPIELATPRLKTPRLKVSAGSIGIAEQQTGIYPIESPGGWRIIGRTTLKLFNPANDPPCMLRHGDRVKFIPVPPSQSQTE